MTGCSSRSDDGAGDRAAVAELAALPSLIVAINAWNRQARERPSERRQITNPTDTIKGSCHDWHSRYSGEVAA